MLKGTKQSEIAKLKISRAMTGRGNPSYGRPMSDLNRKNASRVMKCCWASPEWRAKWQNARWEGKRRCDSA